MSAKAISRSGRNCRTDECATRWPRPSESWEQDPPIGAGIGIQPGGFPPPHGAAAGGRIVILATQMIKTVRKIQCQFPGRTAGTAAALLERPFGVQNDFRRGGLPAGKRRISLNHHIRRYPPTKARLLVPRHGGIVREHHGQFAKWRQCLIREGPLRQRPRQAPDLRRSRTQNSLTVEQVNLHGDRDSFHAGCW